MKLTTWPRLLDHRFIRTRTRMGTSTTVALLLVLFSISCNIIERGGCESLSSSSSIRMSSEEGRKLELDKIRHSMFPDQSDVKFTEYELNVQVSNSLPLERSVPDYRLRECHLGSNSSREEWLPDVSVIIPVYNEAWSMLLRGLHSLLNRTPVHLLREIILIDDASTYSYLGLPLHTYATTMSSKIRILRNQRREGLIRARLRGAREALGEVLVFLDGHTEVNVGWLEPLLRLILNGNRTTLALPQIDPIDVNTIAYDRWNYVAHGGLSWSMDYIWKYLPPSDADRASRFPANPIQSPTALGCAMAIDRRFFFDLGAFDDGMFIWGGENIELSLRVWMCHGSIYISPCSRVGHAFRHWLPYAFPASYEGATVKRRNYERLVDVWLDDFRRNYYAINGHLPVNHLAETYHRSLDARRHLRQRLGCHNFSWFLQNIVPEMATPDEDALHFGQLENMAGNVCVTSSSGFLRMTSCGWHDLDHSFVYTVDSFIRSSSRLSDGGGSLCLTATSEGYAALQQCDRDLVSQRWTFDSSAWTHKERMVYRSVVDGNKMAVADRRIKGKLSALNEGNERVCLSQVTLRGGEQIAGLLRCSNSSSSSTTSSSPNGTASQLFQFWLFTYNFLDWKNA